MKENILEKATSWLSDSYDVETRTKVQHLIDHAPKELEECFGRDLEFGTGGLRGIMGVGTNRMNEYTVAMATQGLANYLNICFKAKKSAPPSPTTVATTAPSSPKSLPTYCLPTE